MVGGGGVDGPACFQPLAPYSDCTSPAPLSSAWDTSKYGAVGTYIQSRGGGGINAPACFRPLGPYAGFTPLLSCQVLGIPTNMVPWEPTSRGDHFALMLTAVSVCSKFTSNLMGMLAIENCVTFYICQDFGQDDAEIKNVVGGLL